MSELAHLKTEPPFQISLFETDEDGPYTNTIDLWDIAPRFVFYTDRKKGEGYLKSIRRSFKHAGVGYTLLLRPGRIVRADGEEHEEFPGERESIVEAILLKLASDRGRLSVFKDKIRLTFTLYEIRAELQKVRHTFSISEIKDALTILHTASVEITQVGSKTTQVLSSTGIPVLAFRKKEEDERHFLEFNPLVENAIKCQRFRLMNYEWLMAMGHPLSRWLYRKLCQPNTDADDSSSVTMTAMEIAENGGIAPRSRPRDTLRFVAKAVDGLVDIGLLEPVQRQTERQGRKNTDIVFDLVPTPKFLADLRKAERVSSDGRARMKQVAGTDRPESFVPVERQVAVRARAERRKLFRADAPEGAAA